MSERNILIVKEFLFGNIQIEFKSQGLLYKASSIELGTPHETHPICFTKQKLLFENEGDRDKEERDW